MVLLVVLLEVSRSTPKRSVEAGFGLDDFTHGRGPQVNFDGGSSWARRLVRLGWTSPLRSEPYPPFPRDRDSSLIIIG